MSFNIGDMVQFVGFRRPLRLQPKKKLQRYYLNGDKYFGMGIVLETIPAETLWHSGYTDDDCGYKVYFFDHEIQERFYQEELRKYDE